MAPALPQSADGPCVPAGARRGADHPSRGHGRVLCVRGAASPRHHREDDPANEFASRRARAGPWLRFGMGHAPIGPLGRGGRIRVLLPPEASAFAAIVRLGSPRERNNRLGASPSASMVNTSAGRRWGGQSVIVTDQNDVGHSQGVLNLLGVEKRVVVAEGLAELPQVFAAIV